MSCRVKAVDESDGFHGEPVFENEKRELVAIHLTGYVCVPITERRENHAKTKETASVAKLRFILFVLFAWSPNA